MPDVASALSGRKLDEIFNPANYLGESEKFIDAAIAAAERTLKT
jgi:hypothetical protein